MPSCGQVLADLLQKRGLDLVFGIPGNHTLELYRGLDSSGLRHITVRHEQGAAFMADGYARVSGRPGICYLISGPGLLNAATAAAQALADSIPMLIVTAVAPRDHLGKGLGDLHELPDQQAAARSFCKQSLQVEDPAVLPDRVREAFDLLQSGRPGPVHLEIPLDVLGAEMPSLEALARLSYPDTEAKAPPAPNAALIEEFAEHLRGAERPILLLGGGAIGAADWLPTLAETLDAPVLNTTNAKGLVPCTHPLAVGGSLSIPPIREVLRDHCDLVLAIGTEFGETDYNFLDLGQLDLSAKLLRIDIDPRQLQRNQTPLLAMAMDAGVAVGALLETLAPQLRGGAERAATWRKMVRAYRHYHPDFATFFDTLQKTIPGLVLVGDSTRPVYYGIWQYECDQPRSFFHSATGFGTLGYAIPAAFGARLGTDRPVAALIGDGGAQFTLPELATGVDNGIGVPILIWRNRGYEEITNSSRALGISDSYTSISAPDFSAIAHAYDCPFRQPKTLLDLQRAVALGVGLDRPSIILVEQDVFITTPSGQWYD